MSAYRSKRLKGANISILRSAKNLRIKNSSLTVSHTTNVYASDGVSVPLKELYKEVAQNAILNTGGRADEVKCHPETRKEVIEIIEHWMDRKDDSAANMMWLTGPAGAGKSAIVQTIAERCKQRGVQAANFFFFRTDATRSTARPLVATLLYQIFEFYPHARQAVTSVLSNHPLLFGASIQDQFNQLLSVPLQGIPQPFGSPARRAIVLFIDGLDECNSERKELSQKHILQGLARLVMQNNSPFLVLVSSRAEPHIKTAFKELASPVESIFLDNKYSPEQDIRLFVTEEIIKIKHLHHLAHTLTDNWPSEEDTEVIVKKSSGQFIFAATVMRYLKESSASPKLSLERVLGIAPILTNLPFAHLDALYTCVLSQASDQEAVMDLLSIQLLDRFPKPGTIPPGYRPLSISDFLPAYNPRYTPESLYSCASDLTAILQFNGHYVDFFHASFPDFLEDESRAGEYHIDMDEFAAKFLPVVWRKALTSKSAAFMAISIFSSVKIPTPEVTYAFLMPLPVATKIPSNPIENCDDMLQTIYRLYYAHNVKLYKQIMRRWVSWYVKRLSKRDLNNLESRLLPCVTIYIRISQVEQWATRVWRAVRGQ